MKEGTLAAADGAGRLQTRGPEPRFSRTAVPAASVAEPLRLSLGRSRHSASQATMAPPWTQTPPGCSQACVSAPGHVAGRPRSTSRGPGPTCLPSFQGLRRGRLPVPEVRTRPGVCSAHLRGTLQGLRLTVRAHAAPTPETETRLPTDRTVHPWKLGVTRGAEAPSMVSLIQLCGPWPGSLQPALHVRGHPHSRLEACCSSGPPWALAQGIRGRGLQQGVW